MDIYIHIYVYIFFLLNFSTHILHAHRLLAATLSHGNDFHSLPSCSEKKKIIKENPSSYFRFAVWYFHVLVHSSCINNYPPGEKQIHAETSSKNKIKQINNNKHCLSKRNVERSWSAHKFGGINSIKVNWPAPCVGKLRHQEKRNNKGLHTMEFLSVDCW